MIAPGMPVLLTDNVVFDLTVAAGQSKQLSSQKMSNIYDCAIAIDEIDFYVVPSPLPVNQNSVPGNAIDYGALITTSLRVGNISLMANPVHLRSLGTRYQDSLSVPTQSIVNARFTRYTSTFYRWALSEPIYVCRSGSLDVSLAIDSTSTRPFSIISSIATGARVYVAAKGRLVPNANRSEQAYPFIAEFAPTLSLNSAGVAQYAAASNPTFLNPFFQPLRIHKFVASLYSNTALGNNGAFADALSVVPEAVLIKISDSRGNNIAGFGDANAIPLGGFVNPLTGEWEVERNLDAGQWFNVELWANANNYWANTAKVFPRVAMIGAQMAQFVP